MSKFSLKKLTALVMAFILIMSVSVVGVSAEPTASPLFSISDIETRQGEEFEVTITFAQDIKPAVLNLAALDVSLKYNSEIYTPVQLVKGAGLTAAFDKLKDSTKLHLETGDYVFSSSMKEAGSVNWSLLTTEGFTFAKDSVFAVVTFKANDSVNIDGMEDRFPMTLVVTNASSNDCKTNLTSRFTSVTNTASVDINLATLCDWEFDAESKTYTLVKFNDKNAASFKIPEEYCDESQAEGSYPVARIATGAFNTTDKLKEVVIGKNVKTVESGAFFNCKALEKVVVYSDDASFGSMTFKGSTDKLTIKCLKDSTADTFAQKNSIKIVYFDDISSCTYSGLDEVKYYTGNSVVLSNLKITDSDNAVLKEGKDYSVSYENNIKVGTAVIHITGCGEYWGSYDAEFEILCPYHTGDNEYYSEVTAYADCTLGGQTVKTCSFCGLNETIELEPKEHTEKSWKTVVAPTCLEEGKAALMCDDCNVHFDEKILEKIPCEMQWVTIKEPTCTEEGLEQYMCPMCKTVDTTVGDNGTRIIEKKEHKTDWVVTKPVTCLEDGKKELICSECGDSFGVETITCAGQHLEAAEWVEVTAPTCTKKGSEQLLCVNCGEIIDTRDIPAKGHSDTLEVVTVEATCTEKGSKSTICPDCGDVISTEELPALDHIKSEKKVIKEATCTESGLEGIECERCHEVFESTVIPPHGHEQGDEWVVIKPATCTENGEEGIVCKHCGAEKIYRKRVLTKTGHSYGEWKNVVEPTCTEEGLKQRTCANCKDVEVEVVPALGHKEVWVPTVRPTYKHTGTEKKVCEHCGMEYHKTRTVPKIDPDLDKNGFVSATDALSILQHAVDLIPLQGDALRNADCNGDGKINATDALIILQIATGVITL